MARTEIVMPRFGAQNNEGQLLKWFVKEGDHVEEDDALADVETEKANAEVESLYTGTITEIVGIVGETYAVGTVIAYMEED
jgi:pyruvate/2-oxoglutarate dehydrogenase complex dihydrolipoamide acyltransferase (E2) component